MSLEPDDLLAIGEVVQRSGVPATALHFYEQLGLIVSTRTAGNQRRYRRHMLRRISLIVVAKRLGIPSPTCTRCSRASRWTNRLRNGTGSEWRSCGARNSISAARSSSTCDAS